MWQKIFVWSKKIHRWDMWVVVVLGLWMMFSGFFMHRSIEGEWIPSGINIEFLHFWHNAISQWFLLGLLIQMITGLGMWLSPKMLARQRSGAVTAQP
jgi:hypothetical protein